MPERINRYVILGELGRGAMGVVYRAHDPYLNIDVSIKTVLSAGMNQQHIVRFNQEAKAICQLNHHGLCRVLDFGLDEQSNPYMVLEFINGVSLKHFLQDNAPLQLPLALAIASKAAAAMNHAHRKMIIHRDLKPGNIMLVGDLENPDVKIIDFGIAVMLNQEITGQFVSLNQDIVGTPVYMSPEQASNEKLDPRSDIYSLGCVLFEMLEGAPPFQGDTPFEILESHLSAEPPALTNMERFDVQNLIFKAIAKKPDDRFQTMEQFHQEIVNVLNSWLAEHNLPKFEERISEPFSIPKFLSRRSAILIVLLGLVGTILLAQGLGLFEKKTKTTVVKSDYQIAEAPLIDEFESQRYGSRNNEWLKRQAARGFNPKHGLHLSSGNVDDEGLEALPGMKVTKLWAADLENVTDRGLAAICKLPLRMLNLDANKNFTPAGLSKLQEIKELHNLSLKNADLTSEGLEQIGKIKTLVSLYLSGNKTIGGSGLGFLTGLNNLQILTLGDTNLQPSDLKTMSKMKNLWYLIIAGNRSLTDDDVIQLIESCPRLRILDVNDLKISDRVVDAAQKAPNLTYLIAVGCSDVSDAARKRFEDSRVPADPDGRRRLFRDIEHWAYFKYVRDPHPDVRLLPNGMKTAKQKVERVTESRSEILERVSSDPMAGRKDGALDSIYSD